MSDSTSLRDRYFQFIDTIVDTTLKGKIRSVEQVYQMLVQEIDSGTGEIFERSLGDRLSATQYKLDHETDELKAAKATRIHRALQTIEKQWERWQKENRVKDAIASACDRIIQAEPNTRLFALLREIDPNQPEVLTLEQQRQLAKTLTDKLDGIANPELHLEVSPLAKGLQQGLQSWQQIEPHLVSWIYEQGRGQLGFGGIPGQNGPWALWAKQVNRPFPQGLFTTLSFNHSFLDFLDRQPDANVSDWIELTVILQSLQRGLVVWFDKMVYDSKVGAKLSISTYLTFALIWSQLANAVHRSTRFNSTTRERLTNACFQVTLQILRAFSQRDYFPLYGGIFAAFTGEYLRGALQYLDEPLRRVEGTQEKARILTLLGYSMRAMGNFERSIAFHQQALDIAREAGDRRCEIANLNHISRSYVGQKNYALAIDCSQRALIGSRQEGERLGEANALANLGFSEVFQAREQGELEPEVYEGAIHYLEQGLQLSDKLADRQSQALCRSSLGIAYVAIGEYPKAIANLLKGWESAQISGDLYLQGLNLAYLAQAHYRQQNLEFTLYFGGLGMYLLEQIEAQEWRQSAGLLSIIQGQMGAEAFQGLLEQNRPRIIPAIGVDGYDHIFQLLEAYQRSLE
jgi:tetratricopeptide (TPR) repeat protein